MNDNLPDDKTRPIPLVEEQTEAAYAVENGASVKSVPAVADAAVVQLRAEELVPIKEWVETGAVLIRKGVEVYPQTIPVEVLHEEVHVETVPANRVLAEGEVATPRQEGDVLIIPVVHEELVAVKRYVVREELRVTKVRVAGVQEVSGTVRRENVSLETTGNAKVLTDDNSPRA